MSCGNKMGGEDYFGGDVSSPYFGGDETYTGGASGGGAFYVTKNVRDSNNRGAKAFSWLTTALLVMYILAAIFYMIYSNTSRDLDVFMTIFFIISGCLIFKDMIEVSYQS